MMKAWWKCIGVAAVACCFAVATATAQTKMVAKTDDKKTKEGPPRKILVLAISTDPSTRTGFEDAISGELSLRGATAVAAFVSFPELPKERGPFEKALVADGYDAVTVSRLVGRDDKLEWVPGTTTYSTDYVGMDCWGGYWYTYQQVFVPGYLDAEVSVRVRTDLWRTSGTGGRLVWSGTTDTIDPTSVTQAAHDVGTAVAKALAKAKLI